MLLVSTLVRLSTGCGANTENRGNAKKKPSKTVLFGYLINYILLLFYKLPNSYHLTANYYLNSLQNELPILLEKVPFRAFYFISADKQQNSSSPAMNVVICRGGPHGGPPQSLDLILLDVFFCGYRKELVYQEKSQTIDELLRRVMDAAAHIWNNSEGI
jgi:hypothetical protein